MHHACFGAAVTPDIIILNDLAMEGCRCITNDADYVIAALYEIHSREKEIPMPRVVYEDSMGLWDELVHDGKGKFLNFNVMSAKTVDEAIDKMGIALTKQG